MLIMLIMLVFLSAGTLDKKMFLHNYTLIDMENKQEINHSKCLLFQSVRCQNGIYMKIYDESNK